MKKSLLPCIALLLVACERDTLAPEPELAPVYRAEASRRVDGQYIVMLKGPGAARPTAVDATVLGGNGAPSLYIAPLDDVQLDAVRRDPATAWVEEVQTVHLTASQSVGGTLWGLDRIDQTSPTLDGVYNYLRTGEGVTVYIVDSGIKTNHNDFAVSGGSRAQSVFDAYPASPSPDCNGHGTHVAGTVGGKVHGVAKKVQLRSLRVFNCAGSGTTADVVSALNWIGANGVPGSIINMSLGSLMSKSVNVVTDALFAAGYVPVASAGNDANTAPETYGLGYSCIKSPASAIEAVTVAATEYFEGQDYWATFSNWGRCVDIYAPGVAILSAGISSRTATATKSGTSMAAPHVSGVLALLRQRYPAYTSRQLVAALMERAQAGVVQENDYYSFMYGTPNVYLNKGGL